MKHFQCAVTEHGNIRFGAIESGNAKDDVVYALNWALWGLRREAPQKARAHYKTH